jgi:hypothetical protein
MAETKHKARDSGGVALRLAVCAVSFAVLGAAIVAFMGTFKDRKADDYRKALSMCDSGLQEAFIRLSGGSPDTIGGFKGEPDEGGANFSVEFERENRGDTLLLKIVSTGVSGSVTQAQERTLRYMLSVTEKNDSAWVNADNPAGGALDESF